MLLVEGAVLLQLQASRSPPLVLGGGIVLVLALRALKVNDFAGHGAPLSESGPGAGPLNSIRQKSPSRGRMTPDSLKTAALLMADRQLNKIAQTAPGCQGKIACFPSASSLPGPPDRAPGSPDRAPGPPEEAPGLRKKRRSLRKKRRTSGESPGALRRKRLGSASRSPAIRPPPSGGDRTAVYHNFTWQTEGSEGRKIDVFAKSPDRKNGRNELLYTDNNQQLLLCIQQCNHVPKVLKDVLRVRQD